MEPSKNSYTLVNMPLEVIEVVAGYLSVQDLLTCCTCSKRMRDIFSDNSIWRPRCNKKLCDYLRVTPCKVEPYFQPKFDDNSSLSEIPQWKVSFMYQNHLWNNWRQGRSLQEVIGTSRTSQLRDDSIFHLFLSSDFIIAVYPKRIEILDVREFPAAKASSDIILPTNILGERDFKVMAGDGMVVILYHTLVLVYQIDFLAKRSILENVFFIEDSQATPNVHDVKDLKRLMECAKSNRKPLTNTELVGNLFIGAFRGESVIHIWDIKSGLRVTTQGCPIKHVHILDFKSTDTMNLVICVHDGKANSVSASQNSHKIFLAYNLETLSFLPFEESFSDVCKFTTNNKYVAIWDNSVLNIYDFVECKQTLRNHPIESSCHGFRHNFVFTEGGILKVCFPSEGVVKPFHHKHDVNRHIEGVNWFETLRGKFIQVRSNKVYEIDDEGRFNETTSSILWFQSCSFFLNKTLTRYIVRSGCGNVIHFW